MSHSSDLLEELRAHEEDLASEARGSGCSASESAARAQRRLGDVSAIRSRAQESLFWRRALIACASVAVCLSSVVYFFVTAQRLSVVLTLSALLLMQIGVACVAVIIARSIVHAYSANRLHGFVHASIFVLALASAEVCMLDIDHVEVIIVFAVLTACVLTAFFLHRQDPSIRSRFLLLYVLIGALFLSLLLSEWFGWAERIPLCLYVTPDSVIVPQCHLFVLSRVVTVALGCIMVVFVVSALITLRRVLKTRVLSGVQKWAAVAAILAVFFLPLFVRDLNNYGALSLLFAQPKITQAYHDVLGRNPQQKDLDFYALTGAYRHVDRIRSVLLTSEERRLKVQELYAHILHRAATQEEIDVWNERGSSVAQIQKSLDSLE